MSFPAVFSQVIQLIPRTQFQEWVAKHDADKRTRKLDSWTWFGSLLFGQLTKRAVKLGLFTAEI